MENRGNPWKPPLPRLQAQNAKIHNFHRYKARGNPWKPVETRGNPWNRNCGEDDPVETHGTPWKTVETMTGKTQPAEKTNAHSIHKGWANKNQ